MFNIIILQMQLMIEVKLGDQVCWPSGNLPAMDMLDQYSHGK